MEKNVIEMIESINDRLNEFNNAVEEIPTEDINRLTKRYIKIDGKLFDRKMVLDLLMWTDFAHDYKLDKYGGILLLRTIMDRILEIEKDKDKIKNTEAINKYIEFYKH